MFLDIFNRLIDIREKICDKRVVIFGSGTGGKKALFTLLQLLIKPNYFVDNQIKENEYKTYLEYKIFNPQVLLNEDKKDIAILVASAYDKEISEQLTSMGFERNNNFFSIIFDSAIKNKDPKILKKKKYDNCTLLSSVPPNAKLGKNVIIMNNVCIQDNVKIGKNTYIMDFSLIGHTSIIGKYCSIAMNVAITPGQHIKNLLSTHPSLYPQYKDIKIETYKGQACCEYPANIENAKKSYISKQTTKIGNDVWIGRNAVIMDKVNIGDGAIIGAGAIVTHNIPPYAIAIGMPAKVTGYRFSNEIIKKLLKLKWWNMDDDLLMDLPINIEECIKVLESRKNLR